MEKHKLIGQMLGLIKPDAPTTKPAGKGKWGAKFRTFARDQNARMKGKRNG